MPDNQSDLFANLHNMLNSDQIPDGLKELLNGMQSGSSSATDEPSSASSNPDFDLNLFLKLKSVMDGMNASGDDPRSNLLRSLKPYLKPSRKEKVDQYIRSTSYEQSF